MLNQSRFDPVTIVFVSTLLPTNLHLSNYRVYQFLNPRVTQLLPKIYPFFKNIQLEKKVWILCESCESLRWKHSFMNPCKSSSPLDLICPPEIGLDCFHSNQRKLALPQCKKKSNCVITRWILFQVREKFISSDSKLPSVLR